MSEQRQMEEIDLDEEGTLRIDLEGFDANMNSTRCLIGRVATSKAFNVFGFLEAMNGAMAPLKGFEAREIDKNLFSFQFNSEEDMRVVLDREPWLFDKKVVILRELQRGEQPSTLTLNRATFWVRMYELPMAARTTGIVTLIAGKLGELLEIDASSLAGFTRSVRVKIKMDLQKPLKGGIHLELREKQKLWIEFKYERLPSFCYLCGMLGHMRMECDLAEGLNIMMSIADEKLPFREWMKASPSKKAAISTSEQTGKPEESSIRRRLFEKFRRSICEDRDHEVDGKNGDGESSCIPS
ncbi:hypothetical protein ACS0TY_004086 [Phlomoides rotata]